jgi:DNA-binding transcriptional MerR regulator
MPETESTLKEMCAAYEVTPRTLRYYEYIELISPRRDGRTRHYGPREKARLKLILQGRRFGFALEEIRQWLEMYNQDPDNRAQTTEWLNMASRQMSELESRKLELQEIINELDGHIALAKKSLSN